MLSQTCARRELAALSVGRWARLSSRYVGGGGGVGVGEATLAWSEPLTTLLRSAQSRVSSSRSLCKAAYERPLRLPSRYRMCGPILFAPPRSGPSAARHRRVFPPVNGSADARFVAAAQDQRPRFLKISSGRRGVSSEGHPQQEPAVWARQRAPTAGVRGHCPEEDIPRRPRAMDSRTRAQPARGDLTSAHRAIRSKQAAALSETRLCSFSTTAPRG
jgi:hypothetical protein